MIHISGNIAISETEIELDFIRSPGPGGQNVNKVATAVQLRFNLDSSDSIPNYVKDKLRIIARRKINSEGVLVIESHVHRTQRANRDEAIRKLIRLIAEAAHRHKRRIKTNPTKAAVEKRLDQKKINSEKKKFRTLKDYQ